MSVVRGLSPRNRCLITAHWFCANRISSTVALTVGHVWRNGDIVQDIAIEPRHQKGKRGRTRRVPVSPELRRALTHHLWWMRLKYTLTPDLPLFPSRQVSADGSIRSITRVQAYIIIKRAFAVAGIEDDGRLGTHVLRKTMAKNSFAHCKDIMVLRDMLNHVSVNTSQCYLDPDAEDVRTAMLACDFTRRPRAKVSVPAPAVPVGSNLLLFTLPPAITEPATQPLPQANCAVY